MKKGGWIGVDLDGTLAFYDHWRGAENIGDPIPAMLKRVRGWLEQGETVKILTARAADEEQKKYVREWLDNLNLQDIEITDKKDFSMIELWDDRCVTVEKNTGKILTLNKEEDL